MFRHRLAHFFSLLAVLPILVWALLTPLASTAPETGRSSSTTYTDTGQALGNAITRGIVQADFDGDGDLDFYAANNAADLLWLNDGSGTFTDSGQSLTTLPSFRASAGDVDGDGDLDVAVGHIGGVTLWLNDGSGTFSDSGQSVGAGASIYNDALLADLDGDSDPDLVLGVDGPNEVWLNQSGTFTNTGQALGEFPTNDVGAADMDGDGDLDIVTANGNQFFPTAMNIVWLNDGSGTFTFGASFAQLTTYRVALLDVDSDNDIDIYAPSFDALADTLWLNNGSGLLTQSTQPLSSGNNTSAVAADMDGDGDTDIVLGRDSITGNGNEVWLNHSGVLSPTGQTMGNQRTWDIGTGDLNGDGDRDLVFGNFSSNRVWLAGGGGGPTPTHTPTNTATPTATPTGTPTPPTPAPADALAWHRDVGASAGNVGNGPDMSLDSSGRPHFSHLADSGSVDYAHFDGVRWYRESIAGESYSSGKTLLALDQQDRPVLAHQENISRIDVVRRQGTAWPSLGALNGQSLADLLVDGSDRPVLAYENDSSRLAVARWDGTAWLTDEIDTQLLDDVAAALAEGPGGTLYLAYVADSPTDELRLATFNGSAWNVETALDDGGDFVTFREVDLALDDQDRPVLLYTTDNGVGRVTKNGGTWTSETIFSTGSTVDSPSLAFDTLGQAHVLFKVNARPYYDNEPDGWNFTPLPGEESVTDITRLALDNSDRPRFGYRDGAFANLNYHFYGATWERLVLEISDGARVPSVAHVRGDVGVAYYSLDDQVLQFLERTPGGWDTTPVSFLDLPGADSSVRMDLRGSHHISYRDTENDRLMYARFDGTTWQTEVVDESGDVGYGNTLFVTPFERIITYWERGNERAKIAWNDGGGWNVSANVEGIPLNGGSGNPRAVVFGGVAYVTYYDVGNQDLRLAEFDFASETWTDSLLVGGSQNNVSPDHDMSLGNDGVLHLVYHSTTFDTITLATRDLPASGWSTETVVRELPSTWQMAVENRTYAGSNGVRLVYADTFAGSLVAAARVNGQWQFETVRDGDSFLVESSLSLGERPYLSYAALESDLLQFAVRAPHELQRGVRYNPYNPGNDGDPANFLADACAALLDPDLDSTPSLLRGMTPLIESDYDVFDEMTRVFSTTPGGQQYIALYDQHVTEMVSIGAQDPRLMWDSYQVLQDFMPGLEALVTGQGDTITVTQRMADNGLDIWQRLAAAGSPELAATINSELADSNDLQDFVGLSFDEWALEVGVVPPVQRLFLPVVQNGASSADAPEQAPTQAALPDAGLWQRFRDAAARSWPWGLSLVAVVLPAFGWWRGRGWR